MPTADPASPHSAPAAWSRIGVFGLAVIIGLSAAIRGAAMFNDLWLDELWTLRNLAELKSPTGIFTQFLNDNNHPLASLWMYLVRPTAHDWLFRLPSWLAGIAAVWLAAEIARLQFRRLRPAASAAESEAAALITAALVASAYLLTVYFSEARGYGPAVAFALLALLALLRDPDGTTWRWTITYWLVCAFGLLAHATMVHVLAGGAAWSLVRVIGVENKTSAWLRAVRWHAVPVGGAALYYFAFLRHLSIGGGPETTALAVLGEAVGFTLGLPTSTIVVALTIFGLVAGLAWMGKRSRELAALYGAMVFVAPLATIALSRFSLLFPRYLIVACVGALLIAGLFIAVAWTSGRAGRIAAVGLSAVIVIGSSLPTLELLRHGRGNFRAVLRYLAAHTPTPEISVCSDQDNRTVPLLQYYAPSTLPDRAFRYVRGASPRLHGARWLLVHQVGSRALGPELRDDVDNAFTLETRFPHAPLSGGDWLIYRDRTFPTP